MSICRSLPQWGLALGLIVSANAHADSLGFAAGAGAWQQDYSGSAADTDERSFDIEDDLDLNGNTPGYFWARLEHPVPVLPNVRLEHTSLDTDGDGRAQERFTFQGRTFTLSERVSSELELDQTDAIGYYQILDNVVSLDAGLNVRFLDGRIEIKSKSTGETASESFSGPVPLAYLAGRVDVPGTGLWVGGQGSGIAFDGDEFLDLRATLGYEFDFGLGLELGYRRESLEVDNVSDVEVDFEVEGGFAGAYFAF